MLGGNVDRTCPPSTSSGPFRIFSVVGYQNRANDIVYCPPIIRSAQTQDAEQSTAIVYFGGDVQDFPESMETNRDSRGYMKYNLENSAMLLRDAFPHAHIIVIRPVRMEFKTFSCFDNFVRGNNAGVPDHTPMNHALLHLEKLLQNLSSRLLAIPENEIYDQAAQIAAAAVAAASEGANTAANSNTASTCISESNQEMDIDIVQVQDSAECAARNANNVVATVDNVINGSENVVTQNEDENELRNIGHDSIAGGNISSEDSPMSPMQCSTDNLKLSELNSLWWRENLNLDKSKLMLMGFSKGCVVLNQFIYEFHYLKTLTPDDSSMGRLLSRINDIYWLDGGHGGQKNTWITSRSLLETLTRMNINIHVHLTPYQVKDDRRPWIRKEEKIFTDLLLRLGAPISRHMHFENQQANLMTHFEVLQAFCEHINGRNRQQNVQSPPQVQQQQPQVNDEQKIQTTLEPHSPPKENHTICSSSSSSSSSNNSTNSNNNNNKPDSLGLNEEK